MRDECRDGIPADRPVIRDAVIRDAMIRDRVIRDGMIDAGALAHSTLHP
jgi:hypothetical protein